MKRTALHGFHEQHGGRMVDFAGWAMPIQYSSILEEHRTVREGVGLFDVSHMGELRIEGERAEAFLDYLLTNRIAGLAVGRGRYSPMCAEDGGVIDDLIVYRLAADRFLAVVNAANREKDLAWIEEVADGFGVGVRDVSDEFSLLAVQGPRAVGLVETVLGSGLDGVPRFGFREVRWREWDVTACRTGYTGEDGFEILVANAGAVGLAEALVGEGAVPCGLGARDSLRLEAGFPLYGHEFDATRTPFEGGVGWTVKLDKERFCGRESLVSLAPKPRVVLHHFVAPDQRQIREGSLLYCGEREVGRVASGAVSPILKRAIGSAHLEPGTRTDSGIEAEVRGRRIPLSIVKPPLHRHVPDKHE